MKKEFRAESKRMMDLMIHSIYTNKEIFLRELISNASDAIDKLLVVSAAAGDSSIKREDRAIILTLDKANRQLIVSDNGIGMNGDDLEENLGVIAASGSLKFKKSLEAGENLSEADIIGQFGVGFYSAFIVADRVEVVTRKYGEAQAWRWISDDADGYIITEAEKDTAGTDVILHIREDGEEKDEYSKYIREYPIYKLVRKYSDYIRFPIKMLMPHPVRKEGSTDENPEYEEIFEYEILNSMTPIWQKNRSEVSKEEFDRFYMEHFGQMVPPRSTLSISAEGSVTYKALLYIPASVPKGYNSDEYHSGLQLYSSGVLIMEDCRALLPEYFDFVRGIVDSPDLSLNISRETLQQDRQLHSVAVNLEKKVRNELMRMLRDDRSEYERFYQDFGRHLKLSALDNYGAAKEKIQDLLLFRSSLDKGYVTLNEYVDRMPSEQKYIYYVSGGNLETLDRLPQTEVLKDRHMEILYFTDKTDEFIADLFIKFKDKAFRSVKDGDLGLEDTKKSAKEFKNLLAFIKQSLGDKVDEVVPSGRLKNHPVCLSSGDGITFEMEMYFRSMAADLPKRAKRILEINVSHPAILVLNQAMVSEPERAAKYAEILYQQASMIAGLPIEDPTAYTDLLCSLWR